MLRLYASQRHLKCRSELSLGRQQCFNFDDQGEHKVISLLAQRANHKLGLGRAIAKHFDPPFVPSGAGDQDALFGCAHARDIAPPVVPANCPRYMRPGVPVRP